MEQENFKIFISWSKPVSKNVAKILATWLELFFKPSVKTFMSERDIPPGVESINRVTAELRKANAGIFCITSENLADASSWIPSEAGSVAHNPQSTDSTENLLIPFIFDAEEVDLNTESFRGILRSKERVFWNQEDKIKVMLKEINDRLSTADLANLNESLFDRRFAGYYPKLATNLRNMSKNNDSQILEGVLNRVDLTEWENQVLWQAFKKGNLWNDYFITLDKAYEIINYDGYCYGAVFQAMILLEVRGLIEMQSCGVPGFKLTLEAIKRMQKLDTYASSQYLKTNCR